MKKTTVLFGTVLFALVFVGASCSSSKGGDGGIFKSSDAGDSWERKVFVDQQKKKTITIAGVDTDEIVIDPTSPDVIYLATRTDGVFKTTTAGEQWTRLNTPAERVRDIALVNQNTSTLYAVHGRNVIKSIDAGETWETVYTDTDAAAVVTRVTVDPTNGSRVYIGNSTGVILVSQNEGDEWKVLYEVDEPITGLFVHPANANVMYALEFESGLHKTVDGGKTWVNVFDDEFEDEFDDANRIKNLSIDPSQPDTLYATSKEGVIRSRNGGAQWEFVKTLIARDALENAQIRTFVVANHNSNLLYFTVGRLIHKSEDGGSTWQTIETFPSARRINAFAIHPNNDVIIYAGVEKSTQKKSIFSR